MGIGYDRRFYIFGRRAGVVDGYNVQAVLAVKRLRFRCVDKDGVGPDFHVYKAVSVRARVRSVCYAVICFVARHIIAIGREQLLGFM